MESYTIDFWRSLTDDDGQSHEVCESRIHVEANSPDEARKRAEAAFCEEKGVQIWTERADRMTLEGHEERPGGVRLDEPWRHVDT